MTTDSTGFFFKPDKSHMWDTWAFYHHNTFYLYYLAVPFGETITSNGVGLAISHDGVFWQDRGKVIEKAPDATWLGSGAVWPAVSKAALEEKFIMNFSEWRGDEVNGRQTIFFAESKDLIHWSPLGSPHEFRQDTRWYEQNGRWDNIWPVARPHGGYLGYWAATPSGEQVGIGFGESADGIRWEAREPPLLAHVPLELPKTQSPEVSAVYPCKNQYYALIGLDDLKPFVDLTDFRPGQTTFIAGSPAGPFVPAPKNRRLLVGNASYFTRFIDTPDGVLVNHHSWEILTGAPLNVDDGTVCLPPLKRAAWDEDGTLRLRWWEGNERAKGSRVQVNSSLMDTAFDPTEILILEGVMALKSSPTGFYLQGMAGKGTGFLVHANGVVEYGDIDLDGTGFKKKGHVDRELTFKNEASFRLIRHGRITEFYLDDYLMQCYCLPEHGTGHIGVLGLAEDFRNLAAWYCAR